MEALLNGSNGEEWKQAIFLETKNLIKNDTFDIVTKSDDMSIVGCKTVLTSKYKSDGTLESRKAKIVAKRFLYRPGIDLNETFTPSAGLESLRLLIALATEFEMKIHQMDATTAYLNTEIDEEVYMEKPKFLKNMVELIAKEEYGELKEKAEKLLKDLENEEDKICKLKKSLYGLKQAERQWYKKLNETLTSVNFKAVNADLCIYMNKDDDELLLIFVHVDEILIFSKNLEKIEKVKTQISGKFLVKDLGEANHCLGIEIKRNNGTILLSQPGYIHGVLNKYGMTKRRPASTPSDGTILQAGRQEETNYPFRELIVSLMYLAVSTRPDIAYSVYTFAQYYQYYDKSHWLAAKRILRYLKGTINYGLLYKKTGKKITGYIGTDWANDINNRLSYTGATFIFAGASIFWKTCKQSSAALTSTEAAYRALTDVIKQAIYLSKFVEELGINDLIEIIICNDKAEKLANNALFHSRIEHIDKKYNFTREALQNYKISLKNISSESMTADVMTKSLGKLKHEACRNDLGVVMI